MTVTGNLFTEFTDGVDYGTDFNPNEFAYAKTGGTAIGNLNITSLGEYTYEPAPSEIPATGTNTVCCTIMFTQTVDCSCEDVASICFIIEATADPCEGFFHCSMTLGGTCSVGFALFNLETEADGIASCISGFTTARTYSWNPTSGANNFAGANPTVNAAGDFFYDPDESESNGSAAFAIDVTEGTCTSTFTLTVNFDDFCTDFFMNNQTFGP